MRASIQSTDKSAEPLWERACARLDPGSCDLPVRGFVSHDPEQLAPLAYSAFAGTVDRAPLEIRARKLSSIASNRYGPFLPTASFVAASERWRLRVFAGPGFPQATMSRSSYSESSASSFAATEQNASTACKRLFRKTGFELRRVDLNGSPHSGGRQAVPPA
jgi:hypothetical protein